MLVVSAVLVYFAVAVILLLVFRGLTRRNRLVDRMLGPSMDFHRGRRRRRKERLDTGDHTDQDKFIKTP